MMIGTSTIVPSPIVDGHLTTNHQPFPRGQDSAEIAVCPNHSAMPIAASLGCEGGQSTGW